MPEILSFNEMFYQNFEPKMQNRFIMQIGGIDAFLIKTAARPTFTSEVVELDHINVKRKIKGKSTWDDVSITLYDPIVPSGAQMVMDWIRTSHESLTGRDGYAAFYKKDLNIFLLGPVGDKIEQWTLKGAWISQATFGELDWASNDPLSIELTLSIDYAILEY